MIYICNTLKVSKKQKNILVHAAKYHDIGRDNDQDDKFHGIRSAKYYMENIVCEEKIEEGTYESKIWNFYNMLSDRE